MEAKVILTTELQLKAIVADAVSTALKYQIPPVPAHFPADAAPIMSSAQVKEMTGWPDGTFYQKVSEMPDGIVIRGRSKRLLFNREALITWLNTPKAI